LIEAMTSPVEFWFDFSSPYGYLASPRVEAVAAKHGRAVAWRPFLLGAVFKSEGTQPLTEYPRKGAYSRRDFERTARLHGIPFRMPEPFPIATVAAARAFYVVLDRDGETAAARLARSLFAAYWVDGRNIAEPGLVAQVSGLARGQFETAAAKERLRAATAEAIEEKGVFGSPFFIVDGEPFWGADRLEQVDRWLATGGW
jgi:2-hydroxychromene-2-carboxylate isomerase